MKIRILKGTSEIGGNCVELSSDNTTILLDYGTALAPNSSRVAINKNVDAILLSHPHQDHYGEITHVDTNLPIFCGERSLHFINAARIFTGKEPLQNSMQHFTAWQHFTIGDFSITPYLVDHSAMDAYAFLIEGNGKRVLYTGDFRAHGRKKILFKNMCHDTRLKNLDALIMEGTMVYRSNTDFPDETCVAQKIAETLTESTHLSFLLCSSQNIDRMVSAYNACMSAHRIFVVDIYTAWILHIASKNTHVPNILWDNIKVITDFGGHYYGKIKENQNYFADFTPTIFKHKISLDEIKQNPSKYFIKVSPHHIKKVINRLECALQKSTVIYSQWLGYLDKKHSSNELVECFDELRTHTHWVYAHTSGHADRESLQKFAKCLAPKKLIPIHTEHKEDFSKYFDNVLMLEDHEEYSLDEYLNTTQVEELNKLFNLPYKGEHTMSFKRCFSKIELLRENKLFKKMLPDIMSGTELLELSADEQLLEQEDGSTESVKRSTKNKKFIFPAIRENRIDFYWKGGTLFSFDGEFITHNKYASVLVDEKNNKINNQGYIKETKLSQLRVIKDYTEGYERIKENCGNYSGLEALGVASLYERFSCVANTTSDVVILDIEASFENLSLESGKNKKQDRIDMVALNKKTGELFFVEAKHISNKELTSKSSETSHDGKTKVTLQIERYKAQIEQRKDEILTAYEQHIAILNDIFRTKLPTPQKIHPEPILLIFGFDLYQKEGKVTPLEASLKSEGLKIYCKGDITTATLETIVSTK